MCYFCFNLVYFVLFYLIEIYLYSNERQSVSGFRWKRRWEGTWSIREMRNQNHSILCEGGIFRFNERKKWIGVSLQSLCKNLLLKEISFNFSCVFVCWVYHYVHVCIGFLRVNREHWSLGTIVTGGCEQYFMKAVYFAMHFARAVCGFYLLRHLSTFYNILFIKLSPSLS